MFSCEFCKISKNTFFYRTPPVATSLITDFLIICLLSLMRVSMEVSVEKWKKVRPALVEMFIVIVIENESE